MAQKIPIAEARSKLIRRARPDLGEALRTWRQDLPVDFEGFSLEEVDSWRDRTSPRKAQLR